MTERSSNLYYRPEIVTLLNLRIKDGKFPTVSQLSRALCIPEYTAASIIECAEAWLYSARVEELVRQATTGDLEGVTPIGTLNGNKPFEIV